MAVTIKKKGELTTHRITDTKTNPHKQPFVVRSVALAEENEQTLKHLKQTATDNIGRPISSSAILRALLRYAEQQPSFWIAKQIHPLLEEEIEQGRLWGSTGKTVPRGEIERETSAHTFRARKGKEDKKGKDKLR